MKKSTYNLLTKITIYGILLKQSSKGEMKLCSPFLQDMAEIGIRSNEIYALLEEKYPGEVVTRDRFHEGYNKILELKFKQEFDRILMSYFYFSTVVPPDEWEIR